MDGDEKDSELASARLALWQTLSPRARDSFLAPPPGSQVASGCSADTPFSERVDSDIEASQSSGSAETGEPVEWFALLLFSTNKVDHLQLRTNERRVWATTGDGEWDEEQVHP